MEIIHFTPLLEITQVVVGQVGNSCTEPSGWRLSIIIGLVAASSIVLGSTGVGLVGIATTLVGLTAAGASLDAIATALGVHLTTVGGSLEVLGVLINAIRRVLGC